MKFETAYAAVMGFLLGAFALVIFLNLVRDVGYHELKNEHDALCNVVAQSDTTRAFYETFPNCLGRVES